MGLSITDLFTPSTTDQWEAKLLQIGAMLGLQTTAWQPGGVTRTIVRLVATVMSGTDSIVSTMAQGGFLNFASAVTPDPSVTPGVAPGWLDAVGQSMYNVEREPAQAASGSLTLTNSSGVTYTFDAGNYHVSNPSTGQTYSNTDALSIPPGGTSAHFSADIPGAAGTSAPGTITNPVTVLVGVGVNNLAAFVGTNAESNPDYVARCLLKLQSLSPDGAEGAFEFFALSASTLLAAVTPPLELLGGPITRALAVQDITTGTVTVTLANGGGVPSGSAKNPVAAASNSTPIALQTTNPHGCQVGDTVVVSGVLGNTAANGTWTATGPISSSVLRLLGSVGNGAYTGGGVAECGDVGLTDIIIQKNAVPDSVTEITQAAVPHAITFAVDVWVPSAFAVPVVGVVQNAIAAYIAALPIGGLTVNAPNIVPFDAVLATALKSASYIQQATLTMNGGTADITLATSPIPEVATVNGTIAVTVHPL